MNLDLHLKKIISKMFTNFLKKPELCFVLIEWVEEKETVSENKILNEHFSISVF